MGRKAVCGEENTPLKVPIRCIMAEAAVHRFHAASHRARIPGRSASVQCFSFAEEVTVIARIWHGYTKPEHADAYEAMLKPELLPGIGRVKGYRGSYLLRKEAGNEVEFITIMLWDSLDAIRAVTGPDYENAVIPEERRKYLSRHDAKSAHYEIASIHKANELSSVVL